MRVNHKERKNYRSAKKAIASAAVFAMEQMEDRVMLSTTVAAWTFTNLSVATNLSPAPSTGTGTALSIGFQTSGTNTNSPGGVYAYPTPGAVATTPPGDISAILVGSGNNPANGGQTDQSSEGVGANAWRLRGCNDGWSSTAGIGTQGAQFSTSTVGYSSIVLTFDLDPSSGSATDAFQVEYTTDGTTWINAPAADLTIGTVGGGTNAGASDGMTIATNTTNPNIVNGSYFEFANPANGDGLYWQNGIQVSLTGISGVNNDANFGVRIVNAATGSADLQQGGATSPAGNWRIDDIKITAGGAAPAVTTQPISQVVAAGNSVSFTATASGNPTPTVQWWVNNGSGFAMDTTDSDNTTDTLTISSTTGTENGYQYEAIFSSAAGSATSNAATLTVATSPVINGDPASQEVAAGSTVTLVSSAIGVPTLSDQWYYSTNGGSSWNQLNNGTGVSGATTPILTLTANESITGTEYEATYMNGDGMATTTAATVTVQGTPITQWNFSTGEGASPGGDTSQGTGNSPDPTTYNGTLSDNSAEVLGMTNSYDGNPSGPEADIIPIASNNDPGFSEYVWRVRGGSGEGPTGSPGNPDGWSQNAPQDTQGVEFTVDTQGYSNVTLNFNWTQGAIGDMQAQYNDDGTWVNVGTPIQALSGDYYGATAPTTTSQGYSLTADTSTNINVASSSGFFYDEAITVGGVGAIVVGSTTGQLSIVPTASGSVSADATVIQNPDPSGVEVNLQGVSFANNNPDLQVRLVSVYDPALPNIIDGNPFVNGGVGSHGQYASGFGLASDIQVIDLDSYVASGGTTDNPDTSNFTLTFNGHTTGTIVYSGNATTMAANIQTALSALSNIGAGNVLVSSTIATNTYTPPGPITAYNGYSVIFQGALKNTVEPQMTISSSGDSVATWQNATPNTITTTTTAPYSITANQSVVIDVASTTGFTSGSPILLGTLDGLITHIGSGTITVTPVQSGAIISGTTVQQFGATGFVDGGGNWEFGDISFNGDTLTGTPGIETTPVSQTIAAGQPVTFTATAYSETLPTVAWQVSSNGTSWSAVSGGTVTPTGGTFTAQAGNQYTSTYTFTTDTDLDQNGLQYRAVFSNGAGSTDTVGATLTVEAPVAPYILIQPTNESVQQGEGTMFTTYAIGTPTPTVQWQISTNGGSTWTNLADDDVTVAGSATDTLNIVTADNTTQNGYMYRAQFTSSAGVTNTNAVTLTVLPTDGILTDWDFNELYQNVNSSGSSADLYVNSPAPVAAGVDSSLDVGGTATAIGFNLAYNPNDPATGTGSPGAVNADDVATSGPDVVDTSFSENTWRLRSGINATSGGAPANGWSNFVAQYTQGGQFMVPTTGYSSIYITLDWFSTHSGEQNAQEQYTLNGSTWINLGSELSLFAPGNDDFYGDSAVGGVVPVVFDLTGVSGANNDANFGIRLVNAYNTILSNQQAITLNDNHNFTLTFNGHTTSTILYSANNTTMANNIQAALAALSNVGASNVSVTYNSADPTTGNNPAYVVQFQGTLGTSIQTAMTITDTGGSDTVTQEDQYANAQLNTLGNPFSVVAYNGSKGNWRLDNIVFHGTDGVEPVVVSSQVGDGTAQRSTVGSISVTFNTPVTLGSNSFTLYQEVLNADGSIDTGAAPVNVTGDVTASLTDGGTTLTLAVTPGGTLDRTGGNDNGFFVNGIYQLVLNGPSITDTATGTAEFDNGNVTPVTFASNETDSGNSQYFHVLFGDLSGSGTVNASDLRSFDRDYASSVGDSNYNAALDYNGTGTINAISLRDFNKDYAVSYVY